MAIKKDGTVIVDTLIDTKGFNKGVGNMQKSVSGLSGSISKLGIAIAAAFSVKAVINFGRECINLGSDLQEVQNVVDVTFGNMSDRIDEFAKNAITQFGLSELAAKQYASTMGAMLKSMGFDSASVLDMSTTLAGLAGDIASFYNLTGDEAFAKIRAGISGETEPLKQLGINLSVANLEAFALAEGLTKSYNAMTEQEKAMLRYKYLLKTTADAQGDFARTSDSWANQTRILAEQFNSLKATIGQGLINVFTPVIKVLNTLLAKLQTVANAFKALTEEIFGKQETQKAATNLGAIEDEYSGIADATEDAKKAQDKYLTGLDEIKTFQTNEDVGVADVGGGLVDTGVTGEINTDLENTDGILAKLEERFPRLMQFLEDVGAKLKEIVQDIKLGDFKELGGDISDLAILIYDFLSESIDAVDWEGIGKKIGDFLAGIKWIDVIKSALKLRFNIWKAIAEVWFGSFKAAPIETTILTALGLLKFTGLGVLLGNKLKTSLLTALPGAIKSAFTKFGSWIPHVLILGAIVEVGKKIVEQMKSVFDTSDWNIGEWIKNTLETAWSGIKMQLEMWSVQLEVWWQDTWLYNELWELGEWFNTKIAPWFTKEKWSELIGNIKTAFNEKWTEIKTWWDESIGSWWKDNVSPWFTKEKWSELYDSIKTSLSSKWNDAISEWKTSIKTWWDEDVAPWFTKEKWIELLNSIKTSFSETFQSIKDNIVGKMQEMFDSISQKVSDLKTKISDLKKSFTGVGAASITSGIVRTNTRSTIPYLASGAVIPPNAPFMAVLGDQKHGTNIEAPLSTIEQALENVYRRNGNNGNGVLHNHLYLDGREVLTSIIDMAKLEQTATGINPLLLT